MKFKMSLLSIVNVGFLALLLEGGMGGCGGGVPVAASTLEGTYDCLNGCSGTCTFDDVLELTLGKRHAVDDYTALDVTISISTTTNVFDSQSAGSARDDGRFGFALDDATGMFIMECGGPALVDDEIVIDCIAFEEVGGATVETACQQATYIKQ